MITKNTALSALMICHWAGKNDDRRSLSIYATLKPLPSLHFCCQHWWQQFPELNEPVNNVITMELIWDTTAVVTIGETKKVKTAIALVQWMLIKVFCHHSFYVNAKSLKHKIVFCLFGSTIEWQFSMSTFQE